MIATLLFTMTLCILQYAGALYDENSTVLHVTEESFHSQVLDYPGVALVKFYAPWCGHCQHLAPHFDKVAAILDGFVRVAAIDASDTVHLAEKHEINVFPTLKLFGLNKTESSDYQGPRSIKAIVDMSMMQVYALVKARVSLIEAHGVDHVRAIAMLAPEEDEWANQQCTYAYY